LGRPIALASFVPQAYAWPDAPDVFLRTNILIHLLNGILVTWFLYLLGRAQGQDEKKAALIAAGAGALLDAHAVACVQFAFHCAADDHALRTIHAAGCHRVSVCTTANRDNGQSQSLPDDARVGARRTLATLSKENGAIAIPFDSCNRSYFASETK
jgi:hypothetical protein